MYYEWFIYGIFILYSRYSVVNTGIELYTANAIHDVENVARIIILKNAKVVSLYLMQKSAWSMTL